RLPAQPAAGAQDRYSGEPLPADQAFRRGAVAGHGLMRHVIVLGGGACGLTAAYRLARAGCEVTVLEREARPGGLCGTHERSGFRFDFGGHRFLSRSPALEALVRELVGGE